ncbi:TOMM precursor leader peptide-binding protein [Sphingomonas sp. HF-S4]|uniref:TOMM leader peptide-binding protein n=1 Tax=Sphingomonas agrestis TaxID=3080540 RepID=A0ABU3Y3S5_9SPHN|nr:TOMM precursor leader peptide-binding protein [Sphingomonas sp. HF-S4]MDV3456055.1 TOMM precursor leader peptide-binding protein [Sphingomonas sp. HF-S4]
MLIATFPFHEAETALHHEAAAHADGRTVCHLGYDRTRVVIGPIVAPGGAPCLRCARLWAPVLGLDERDPQAAPPMAAALIAALLARFAETERPDPQPWRRMLWFDLETLLPAEHRLMPHPDCPRCAAVPPPSTLGLREDAPASAESWRERDKPSLAALTERLADPRFGLVRHFERETEAKAHSMTFAAFAGRNDPRQLEIGVGRTGCQADDRAVAMLEALERFSGFRPRGATPKITARFADLAEHAVDPRHFILPKASQQQEPGYRLEPFDPDRKYKWIKAFSLRRGAEIYLPLQLAYYDLPQNSADREPLFVSETSNGCALGASFEEAALFGLFEVIERDAYFSTWYGRVVPLPISLDERDDLYARGMVARIEEAGFEVSILDIGVGLPLPAIAVLAIDSRPEAPVASIVSTGAHPNAVQALRGALVEVCTRLQHRAPGEIAALRAQGAAMLADSSRVRSMDDHATLYSHPDSLARLQFLRGGKDGRSLRETSAASVLHGTANLTRRLRALSEAVLGVAEDVLLVDMSNSLTASVGLRCVKVLAPGLLPVTFGHQYRRIDRARLARIDPALRRDTQGHAPWLPHNFQ